LYNEDNEQGSGTAANTLSSVPSPTPRWRHAPPPTSLYNSVRVRVRNPGQESTQQHSAASLGGPTAVAWSCLEVMSGVCSK
jgi:hypothetical protein